jgi:DNA-binding CsgD family transcriptional regulator
VFEADVLVETIYEASVVPEHWPDVLRRIAEYSGCMGGMLVANPHRPDFRWVASENLVAPMTAYTRDGWATRNPKPGRLAGLRHPGFVCDSDLFTLQELENEPIYVELSRPHGFWFSVGTMITVPTGDLLVFDIQRADGQPPIEREAVARLDDVRPHLARAALIAARLGLERARAMTATLNGLGLPGAAFGHDGRVLASNPLLDQLPAQFVPRAFGHLALADPAANALLQDALQRVAVRGPVEGVMSFPVPAVDDHPALIAHVLPVRRTAHDLFTGAVALLAATPLSAPQALSEGLLSGLFDLTPAEARVARAVIEGQSVTDYARTVGLSPETTRTQLKSVFAKTGTRRQGELVALLAGKALPPDAQGV